MWRFLNWSRTKSAWVPAAHQGKTLATEISENSRKFFFFDVSPDGFRSQYGKTAMLGEKDGSNLIYDLLRFINATAVGWQARRCWVTDQNYLCLLAIMLNIKNSMQSPQICLRLHISRMRRSLSSQLRRESLFISLIFFMIPKVCSRPSHLRNPPQYHRFPASKFANSIFRKTRCFISWTCYRKTMS